MGMTGTSGFNFAKSATPFLNSPSSSVILLVPSGKIITIFPLLSNWVVSLKGFVRVAFLALRSMGQIPITLWKNQALNLVLRKLFLGGIGLKRRTVFRFNRPNRI